MGNSFRENLREALDFNGISVQKLSVQTKIPRRSIDNYLNARASMPPADYAVKIAKVLDTTVEALVANQPHKEKPATNMQKNMRLFAKLSEPDQIVFLRLMEGLLKQ